jgi:NH3-dependent NAD+ synthetase
MRKIVLTALSVIPWVLVGLVTQTSAMTLGEDCMPALSPIAQVPREIQPAETFNALVRWIHDEVIVNRKAPGLLIGISGTDSILAFLASAKAFAMAGRPDRVVGLHFSDPQESWFQQTIMPWLQQQAPGAQIVVDSSIDARRDGLRWGALLDWSVIENPLTGQMRLPHQRFWVVGTHNATEEALTSYSNVSNAASVQLLTHLWKSEVLKICKFLKVPQIAINKSCDADCVCGRDQLPAAYIPEVDALLMVREGLLSPTYTENTIPASLRQQLNSYIDFQQQTGRFKKAIPYIADASVIRTDQDFKTQNLQDLKTVLQNKSASTQPLSKVIPVLIAKGLANVAAELVASPSQSQSRWLPEALMLFNTPGLRSSQQSQMIEALFGPSTLTLPQVHRFAKINARLGNYGFSFPQWRFLTQKYSTQPSLAEQFGMTRWVRTTDVRDSSLPPANPNRDFLGTGFSTQRGDVFIEYRRSYIVVSKATASGTTTLVIRNNSYYFGRDRLSEAVYFSLEPQSIEDLTALMPERLDSSGAFHPWPQFLTTSQEIPLADKIRRVENLLKSLDDFNLEMDQWLKRNGFTALKEFLEQKLMESERSPSRKPPLYLAVVAGASPSWFPKSVTPVTAAILGGLKNPEDLAARLQLGQDERLVLLTGEHGDFP